jgi:hypothetical protein
LGFLVLVVCVLRFEAWFMNSTFEVTTNTQQ